MYNHSFYNKGPS